MSVTFCADIHIGNFTQHGGPLRAGVNSRARDTLNALALAVEHASDCEAFVILGDLFHYSNPEPALISLVQEILSQHPNVLALVGNHDQVSSEYGNHALSPLAPVARVIERPTRVDLDMGELWLVPFHAGAVRDWLPKDLAKLAGYAPQVRPRTGLGLHLGISDDATPYYLDGGHGNISFKKLATLAKKHGITDVFSGDWHRHQTWKSRGVKLMQVGALCPNRFPPNYEHGNRGPLATWSSEGVQVTDMPGPRFFKRKWKNGGIPKIAVAVPDCSLYLKIQHKPNDTEAVKAWIEQNRESFVAIERDVDRTQERIEAKTASFEARRASSLDDAVQIYVKKMPVPKGCSREQVLSNVRKFIG